jgi:hypothetical protein
VHIVQVSIHIQKFEGGETTRHGYHLSVIQRPALYCIDFRICSSVVPIGGVLGALKRLEAKLGIDLTSEAAGVHESSKL